MGLRSARKFIIVSLILTLAFAPVVGGAAPDQISLPGGTRLYLTLDQEVTSKRGEFDVGAMVQCRVWRDVELKGTVFIKGGTPSNCRVDKIRRRNIGGFEGKVSIAGVETRSVDGQPVMLQGGYNKEGSGRKTVVLSVGILLLWPVLFVPGGNAELPPGTVFDVSTVNDVRIDAPAGSAKIPSINLASLGSRLQAEFMLDEFLAQPKQDVFRIKVSKDAALPEKLFIDQVNGKPIEMIPLTVNGVAKSDDVATGVAEVKTKTLAKFFTKGINRFDVAYMDGGQRIATEVIMDIQM